MRKILIDDIIKEYAQDYYDELKEKHILDEVEINLKALISDLPDGTENTYKAYLNATITNMPSIIKNHPNGKDSYLSEFNGYGCVMTWNGWKSKNTTTFHDRIVEAMKYKYIRQSIFPKYVIKLGIKTCVYCNTQYALTIDEECEESAAFYELDHAWPKAKYPFLAISFFNLQPCCGPCNKRKSDKGKPYSIYVEKSPAESIVQFSINNESLVDYILTHNRDNLKIQVDTEDKELSDLYDKIGVRKRYSKLNDEAEEMIWKAKIYNEAYFKQFYAAYGRTPINTNTNLFRLLYGIYAGEENVYSRPLTKMKQDIAKQLKMI